MTCPLTGTSLKTVTPLMIRSEYRPRLTAFTSRCVLVVRPHPFKQSPHAPLVPSTAEDGHSPKIIDRSGHRNGTDVSPEVTVNYTANSHAEIQSGSPTRRHDELQSARQIYLLKMVRPASAMCSALNPCLRAWIIVNCSEQSTF